MIKKRVYSLCAVIVSVVIVAMILAQDTVDERTPKKTGPITISKETTYLTGPLNEDGSVDYVAALNKFASRGVTPRNNVAVPVWQAFGRRELQPEMEVEFFRRLGMTRPPKDGEYYVSLSEFVVEQHLADGGDDSDAIVLPLREKAEKAFDEVLSGPWSTSDYPQVVRWLKRNERTLKLAHEASGRTHFYMPYLNGGDEDEGWEFMLIGVLLPGATHCRSMGRLLAIEGNLALGKGDGKKAQASFLACHHLGRVCSRGATLVEGLVGIAIDGIGVAGDVRVVEHGELSAEELRSFQVRLGELPPFSPMLEKVTTTERYMFLDVTQALEKHGVGLLKTIAGLTGGGGSPGVVESIGSGIATAVIDWNIVLKMGNDAYDRMEEIGKIESVVERNEKFKEFDKELLEMNSRVGSPGALARELLFRGKTVRKVASEQMGATLMSMLIPAVGSAVNAEDRGVMNTQMAQTVVGLALFQDEHGRYPKRLAELTPVFIKKVPTDIYSGKPIRYIQRGDGFYLYSVGRDGEDNGGRSFDDSPNGDDQGYKVNFAPTQK